MKKVLFIGDNPQSCTGNGNMLAAILSQLNKKQYKAACFVIGSRILIDPFLKQSFNIINSEEPHDPLGSNKLLNILKTYNIDYLVMVGLDIWKYAHIFKQVLEIKRNKDFCWIAIFPYDIYGLRLDWIEWIGYIDIPCVYSQYGYNILKEYIPNIQYFRPLMWSGDTKYTSYNPKKRIETRRAT